MRLLFISGNLIAGVWPTFIILLVGGYFALGALAFSCLVSTVIGRQIFVCAQSSQCNCFIMFFRVGLNGFTVLGTFRWGLWEQQQLAAHNGLSFIAVLVGGD